MSRVKVEKDHTPVLVQISTSTVLSGKVVLCMHDMQCVTLCIAFCNTMADISFHYVTVYTYCSVHSDLFVRGHLFNSFFFVFFQVNHNEVIKRKAVVYL